MFFYCIFKVEFTFNYFNYINILLITVIAVLCNPNLCIISKPRGMGIELDSTIINPLVLIS